MTCCGKNRMQLRTGTPGQSRSSQIYAGRPQRQPAQVPFVYIGNTGLTVTGPVSGIQYTFSRPGEQVKVDARDRIMLASIRQLQQVK
jgi:hypothetical protein